MDFFPIFGIPLFPSLNKNQNRHEKFIYPKQHPLARLPAYPPARTELYSILIGIVMALTSPLAGQSDPVPEMCGFESTEEATGSSSAPCSHTSSLWSNNARHIPRSDARSIKVHANFIIVQKADGSGNFQDIPEHRDFLDDWLAKCNDRFANLYGTSNCSPLIEDVKIEIIPNWIFYPDATEVFWDNDNNSGLWECPNFGAWWLNPLDAQIVANHPAGINVYLTTDGSAYDEMVILESTDTTTWDHYVWCSEWPSNSNLTRSSRVAINNLFLKYWHFQNHPEVVGAPFSTSRAWLVNGGITLAHEFGHSFISCYVHKSGCPDHLMTQENSDRDFMLEDDAGCMHRNLAISNLRQFVDCEETLNTPNSILSDRIVETDETWDLNIRIYSNVIVRTGASLTITCNVLMPQEGLITVERGAKLIIDGGKVIRANTCDSTQFWHGIAVQGNSGLPQPDPNGNQDEDEAGILLLHGGGTIEGSIAVTTKLHPHLYAPDYFGGLIIADDFTFQNCRKGVEFMKYDFRNKSKFTDTRFERTASGSMHTGVSIWDTDGITFNECVFNNMTTAGIQTFDAGFEIGILNVFRNNLYGIYTSGSTPLSGIAKIGQIGTVPGFRNLFQDNTVGIRGTSMTRMDIFSNDFEDFDFDIAVNGYTTTRVMDNVFNGAVLGNQFEYTSNRHNETLCNEYIGNLAGTNIIGRNIGFFFKEENYNTGTYDLYIEGTSSNPGAIQLSQGSSGSATWNYFTSLVPENIKTSTTTPDNFTEQFFYFHPDPILNSRVEPRCPLNNTLCGTQSNFSNSETTGEPFHNCDFTHGPVEICVTVSCLEQLQDDVSEIELEFGENPTTSLEAQLQKLVTKREYVVDAILEGYVDSGAWNSAEELLLDDLNIENHRRLVSLKVLQNQFESADSLLQVFPIISDDDQFFVETQSININRLIDPQDDLATADRNMLLSIAFSESPEAGFAQALLGILDHQTFMPEIPEMENDYFISPPIHNHNNVAEIIEVYPNPTEDFIKVILSYPKTNIISREIVLNNLITGELISSVNARNISQISLPTFFISPGIYVLSLMENGVIINSVRVIIIK